MTLPQSNLYFMAIDFLCDIFDPPVVIPAVPFRHSGYPCSGGSGTDGCVSAG